MMLDGLPVCEVSDVEYYKIQNFSDGRFVKGNKCIDSQI
jgi:hypothetical protein